jgi:serine/threonine protein kinase
MPPGYLLRNRYRIEHRLAAGGFGETYLAIDEDYPDRRRVVVKHLKPQSNDPMVLETARRLFDTEGVTLANLGDKTDRIPTLYAYFEEDREFYLVQEWIAGQTLTQELGTRKLSETETLSIVREILAVLAQVHAKGIVHRDLKPDNIIRRSRDRQLVLIDFGAVKAVRKTSLNATHATRSICIGTAGYMPIEQAVGYPTAASDIYAVGAIALQCLTGQPPSQLFDEDALELRWQHLCKVSDRTANILAKMVAARHLDRYPNAMEAIKAIDSLLARVSPSKSTPTIKFHPTPAPPAQPQQPTPSKPSRIGNYFVLKCLLGFIGFNVLLYVGLTVLILFREPTDPAVESLSAEKPPSAEISEADDKSAKQKPPSAESSADDEKLVKQKPLPTISSADYDKLAKQKSNIGDYSGALSDYDRAIKLKPNDSNLYTDRGLLKYEKFQNYQGALADYNQAIKLNPRSAITYKKRGLLKDKKLQDSWGALADYNSAIELSYYNDAVAYYHRGLLTDKKFNDKWQVAVDYDSAIKLKPDYAIAYYSRSIFKYNKMDDRPGAVNDMKQAALLYQKQGNKQDYRAAIEQLKKWGVATNFTLDDPRW